MGAWNANSERNVLILLLEIQAGQNRSYNKGRAWHRLRVGPLKFEQENWSWEAQDEGGEE
jgi:hypothetical protein